MFSFFFFLLSFVCFFKITSLMHHNADVIKNQNKPKPRKVAVEERKTELAAAQQPSCTVALCSLIGCEQGQD